MVSIAGISLQNGGRVHHHRLNHRGSGIARRAVGSVLGSLGHALINKIAHAISGTGAKRRRMTTVHRRRTTATQRSGGSYKLTGMGRHKKVGRPRIYRKKTNTLHRRVGTGIVRHLRHNLLLI